ncbi:MAG: hypothetical protein WDO73_17905 [Ignavibacteriota bacterium]
MYGDTPPEAVSANEYVTVAVPDGKGLLLVIVDLRAEAREEYQSKYECFNHGGDCILDNQ